MEGRHRRIQNPVEHLKCNVFVKKVNGLRTLTISQKRSIVYVCQSPKCASGKYWSEKLIVDKVINSSRKSHKYKNNQLNIINLKILYFGSTRKKKIRYCIQRRIQIPVEHFLGKQLTSKNCQLFSQKSSIVDVRQGCQYASSINHQIPNSLILIYPRTMNVLYSHKIVEIPKLLYN